MIIKNYDKTDPHKTEAWLLPNPIPVMMPPLLLRLSVTMMSWVWVDLIVYKQIEVFILSAEKN